MYHIDSERERHTDFMLAVGDTADAMGASDDVPGAQHFEEKVPLTQAVAIAPVTPALADALLDAREHRGENHHLATRQYGARYALVREEAPRGSWRGACDPDGELARTAAILRLARPHAMSLGDAARVIEQPDGRREIVPSKVEGPGSKAFVIDLRRRWIRDEDVALARRLLAALAERELPRRVRWAIVAHELLHWQHHVEVRWLLLCQALEGLVHTNDRVERAEMQSREQFVVRLRKLMDFVGGLEWTEAELDETYNHRNQTMHGDDLRRLAARTAFPPLYHKAEDGLRKVLCAVILNSALADAFSSDTQIRTTLGTMNRARAGAAAPAPSELGAAPEAG